MRLTGNELRGRADAARPMLSACTLCGHRCQADRAAGKLGVCRCGNTAKVASAVLHNGEEPCLRPDSGTIFFSNCPLACVYCQNWQISQEDAGREVDADALAAMMLGLRGEGATNINLVSPTSWVPQILDALAVAAERGLDLPIVYNTGGYDSPEALRLFDGVVDVYLPDMKYSWAAAAERFSGVDDYPAVNRAAVAEMYRQVGDVAFNAKGQAQRGLIVRLLVLPNGMAGVHDTLAWMAKNLSQKTWFSLMAQYDPLHRAMEFLELARPVTDAEYKDLIGYAEMLGFENFYTQSPPSRESLRPDFTKEQPFERP